MTLDANQLVKEAVQNLVQQHGRAKSEAFDSLMHEISTALTDLVSVMESGNSGDAIAKALTQALKSVKIEVAAPQITVKAPEVVVNVAPTPIQNNVTMPDIKFPDMKAVPAKGWDIEFKFGSLNNVPIGAKLTRIN